jgi:predicted enzyme related to lactoylglutathione lyase
LPYQGEFRYVFIAPLGKFIATINFYRDVLEFPIVGGFTPTRDSSRGVFFQAAKAIIEIIEDPGQSRLKTQILPPGEDYIPPTGGFFLFEVPDVDREFQRIHAAGAHIIQNIIDRPWGHSDFKLIDPCGNLLCLFSRIEV